MAVCVAGRVTGKAGAASLAQGLPVVPSSQRYWYRPAFYGCLWLQQVFLELPSAVVLS